MLIMSNQLTSFLNLLYKLSHILNEINKLNKIDNSIKKYLIECKNICINNIKSDTLITHFLNEINYKFNIDSDSGSSSLVLPEQIDNVGNVDIVLPEQIDNVGNIDIVSPEQFDNLGNGLLQFLRISDSTNHINGNKNSDNQIKNELKSSNENIKLQIKKING